MNDERCAYCRAPAKEPDHLTGRPGGTEPYFDPDLSVPSCRGCNLVNEHAWSVCGLLVVTEPLNVVRTKRLLIGLDRLHDVEWPGPVPPAFWWALRRFVIDLSGMDEATRCGRSM